MTTPALNLPSSSGLSCPRPLSPPWRWRAWIRPAVALGLALVLVGWLVGFGDDLSRTARIVAGTSGLALIAWTVLQWDEAGVAIAASLALVALGAVDPDALFATLGNDLVWLLIGGFVIGAALRHSGLGERVTLALCAGATTTPALLRRLAWAIGATAFLIPTTSGRAALLLPVFLVLAPALPTARHVKALALLFPTIVLLSAGASLMGAGAHLVAVDFLRRLSLPTPGFGSWLLWAGPLTWLACAAATGLIGRLFLTDEDRSATLVIAKPAASPLTRQQKAVALIMIASIGAWSTAGWFGIEPALVAVGAALLVTLKPLTGIDLKSALAKVEWNLILFLAAAMLLAEALLDSGLGARVASVVAQAGAGPLTHPAAVVALVSVVALLAHLLVTSRTARTAVLLTAVVLPLMQVGVEPTVLVMLVVLGSGFCQTLSVSAKPIAMFMRSDHHLTTPGELARLSLALLPVMFMLLVLFGTAVWPHLPV
jgi:solute carrier family 13 (sodium-dependent dicarboxylate transporter), member 2/3/5